MHGHPGTLGKFVKGPTSEGLCGHSHLGNGAFKLKRLFRIHINELFRIFWLHAFCNKLLLELFAPDAFLDLIKPKVFRLVCDFRLLVEKLIYLSIKFGLLGGHHIDNGLDILFYSLVILLHGPGAGK